MSPFFLLYGGKHRLAPTYGAPRYSHVIEVFGGGVGFSGYHEPREVTVIEIDPVIYGLWKYLKGVKSAEIMRLPSNILHVDELPSWVPQEAKWLIGFWFSQNPVAPLHRRSPWAKLPRRWGNYWSETIKLRIVSQLDLIRHWKIIHGSYEQAPDCEAHWFIDPPYNNSAGRLYRYHDIDYEALAEWCKSRRGFVQVCEQAGATWLPFDPFEVVKTHRGRGYSIEALCEIDNRSRRRSMNDFSKAPTRSSRPTTPARFP